MPLDLTRGQSPVLERRLNDSRPSKIPGHNHKKITTKARGILRAFVMSVEDLVPEVAPRCDESRKQNVDYWLRESETSGHLRAGGESAGEVATENGTPKSGPNPNDSRRNRDRNGRHIGPGHTLSAEPAVEVHNVATSTTETSRPWTP